MILITPQMRILLAIEPPDFRMGIDGLARLCREKLAADPFSGTLFVFRNRRATALKLLVYDGQGFWIFQKRLSSNKFTWWPKDTNSVSKQVMANELQLLLWNGNPELAQMAPFWRRLNVAN